MTCNRQHFAYRTRDTMKHCIRLLTAGFTVDAKYERTLGRTPTELEFSIQFARSQAHSERMREGGLT
jgi:hypothetical protein